MRENTGQVIVREISEAPLPEEVSFTHTTRSKSVFDQGQVAVDAPLLH